MRLGVLVDAGTAQEFSHDWEEGYGWLTRYYVKCCDCETVYRIVKGEARCNGQVIVTCPWCGPDSGVNNLARGGPPLENACRLSSVSCPAAKSAVSTLTLSHFVRSFRG